MSNQPSSSGRTSAGHSPLPPLATWSRARDAWETGETSLLCGHSDVFSETWPTSGTTRNGVASGRPTWVPATSDSVSSSSHGDETLPTPTVRDYREPHRPDATDTLSRALADPSTSFVITAYFLWRLWIPAFAGMTFGGSVVPRVRGDDGGGAYFVIPAHPPSFPRRRESSF